MKTDTTSTPNPYEVAARSEKVARVVTTLRLHGSGLASADTVAQLGDSDWATVADLSGVHRLSEESRRLVVAWLAALDVTGDDTDDVFEGL